MKRSKGPRRLHNLPSSSNINWSKYKQKNYLHFDERIKIEHMKSKLQDSEWVASYAFLPSIHFEIIFKKYVTIPELYDHVKKSKRKEKKKKVRKIFYSAHKDSYIYKYYGDLLNNSYNTFAEDNNIDEIAVAYRNNKEGKNSVNFAHEVFEHLFKQEHAVIISMDFTSFFDNISHKTLKNNIKRVLNVDSLSDDWYKVFRSLTKFTYVNKTDINHFLKTKHGEKKVKKIKLSKIMEPIEFREFKKEHLHVNRKNFGIPQGSGMSAVCSNVHLIDFDKEMMQWAKQKHEKSLYRRYCDDLILVIPISNQSTDTVHSIRDELLDIMEKYKEDGLDIQKEKTEIRLYQNGDILNEQLQPATLDYLGFVTNGKLIKIREKSLFKYYSRAYRKANTSKRISFATGRPGPKKELYDLYTHLGYQYKDYGNFISYAYKAHRKMNQLPVRSMIRRQVKRHWSRVQKRMK
ncbi:reverse transcriptase domain-containing protein [Psychrobacillus soli]|uniref:Reverse transcriptase n=1 Tax=Psychrobacillus soli TaxID=1543965 RepID=A0A544TB90_9BACI|nr:reverse transcriptase domain-containing protein [Psychrobacillus soli]TQR14737.1 reverse transcriptase [Psychrobacillus soli]